MPPSHQLKFSPSRDRRPATTHRRGLSFESGLAVKAKDDDLALFTDMQNRERSNFLLHTSDDFDESISKLRYFSDFKLGINIPARGDRNDLLNADGDKNDYDWLLTPPDTPLFPSLDDEEPRSVSQLPRGRLRSQPIPLSSSSTIEKGHRTSRSSTSPRRLSPSPCCNSSVVNPGTRPSSSSRSSPSPSVRASTPSRRPSTPPTKSSTPRSSTPTLRISSTSSTGQAFSSGKRGTSPIKASRGNSASPKFQSWQSSLPHFSSDAPLNLRTVLPDRPVSRSRGLSPASGSGTGSSSKFRRQSMSPTPSRTRSASSSHSLERDRLSSHSRASVTSSGDDEVDSLHSVPVEISSNHSTRKIAVQMHSRAAVLSSKPTRNSSASSAPKSSFDSALRLMEQRKAPQNMFRPLLSSVPATTFGVGKTDTMQHPLFSKNSSFTASSTASADHGPAVTPYIEHGWEKTEDPDIQEEVFIFDKVDELNNEHTNRSISTVKTLNSIETDKLEDQENAAVDVDQVTATEVDICGKAVTCSVCRKKFSIVEMYGDTNVCQECSEKGGVVAAEPDATSLINKNAIIQSELPSVLERSSEVQLPPVLESSARDSNDAFIEHRERNSELSTVLLSKSSSSEFKEGQLDGQIVDEIPQINFGSGPQSQSKVTSSEPQDGGRIQQIEPTTRTSEQNLLENLMKSQTDIGGKGISELLMQRSSSSKWPSFQGRAFVATNLPFSESYVRNNRTVMKRSIGHGSSSASSSVDLGSFKQTEVWVHHHTQQRNYLSGQSTSSVSDMSISSSSAPIFPKSDINDDFDYIDDVGKRASKMSMLSTEELNDTFGNAELSTPNCSSVGTFVVDQETSASEDACMNLNVSDSQISQPAPDNMVFDDQTTCSIVNQDVLCNTRSRNPDKEESSIISQPSFLEEGRLPSTKLNHDEASCSSVAVLEQLSNHIILENSQAELEQSHDFSNVDMSRENCDSTTSEKDVLLSAEESNISKAPHNINEESTTMAEGPRRQIRRSFTLEEATDTVLFCSSIIHDLAYKAATIGMEKELTSLEAPRPTVTILGKFTQDNLHTESAKCVPKNCVVKRKRLETDMKTPSSNLQENAENLVCSAPFSSEVPKKVDGMKPPKLESKCNCTIM
ncbi:hypothetical protein ACMD2_00796 [Ananas comosus]|uniref:Uncharacterized protein n=1 Tax=Ananas comosus TaxID=4615 RepID=A0A199V3U0_ANACO|nr:hypothetical protein ACMD2_00796 [Ananas comosus]